MYIFSLHNQKFDTFSLTQNAFDWFGLDTRKYVKKDGTANNCDQLRYAKRQKSIIGISDAGIVC